MLFVHVIHDSFRPVSLHSSLGVILHTSLHAILQISPRQASMSQQLWLFADCYWARSLRSPPVTQITGNLDLQRSIIIIIIPIINVIIIISIIIITTIKLKVNAQMSNVLVFKFFTRLVLTPIQSILPNHRGKVSKNLHPHQHLPGFGTSGFWESLPFNPGQGLVTQIRGDQDLVSESPGSLLVPVYHMNEHSFCDS